MGVKIDAILQMRSDRSRQASGRRVLTIAVLSIACGLALLGTGQSADGATPSVFEIECPVGGARFYFSSWFSYPHDYMSVDPETADAVRRPDGKQHVAYPFASVPPPLPECPASGLVVYREFSNEEALRLRPFVESAEFAQLRHEKPYYIAYRTEVFLNPGHASRPEATMLLLRASWQSDDSVTLKRRYQREFAEAARLIGSPTDDLEVWVVLTRGANALRELGRFREATDLIARIPRRFLDVDIPDEVKRPLGQGWEVLNGEEVREAQGRRALLTQLDLLSILVANGDPRSEPSDILMPSKQQ